MIIKNQTKYDDKYVLEKTESLFKKIKNKSYKNFNDCYLKDEIEKTIFYKDFKIRNYRKSKSYINVIDKNNYSFNSNIKDMPSSYICYDNILFKGYSRFDENDFFKKTKKEPNKSNSKSFNENDIKNSNEVDNKIKEFEKEFTFHPFFPNKKQTDKIELNNIWIDCTVPFKGNLYFEKKIDRNEKEIEKKQKTTNCKKNIKSKDNVIMIDKNREQCCLIF